MPTSYDVFQQGPLRDRTSEQEHARVLLLPELSDVLNRADIRDILPEISSRIQNSVPHDWCGLCLIDCDSSSCHLHAQHSVSTATALPNDFVCPLAGSAAHARILANENHVVPDLMDSDFSVDQVSQFTSLGWRSGCWIPLASDGKVMGSLWLGSTKARSFRAEDPGLLGDIVQQVADSLAGQVKAKATSTRPGQLTEELASIERGFESTSPHPLAILCGDEEGRVLEANEAFLQLVGFTRQEMQAGHLRRQVISPAEYKSLDDEILRQVRERGFSSPVEKEYTRSDGTRIPVMLTVSRSVEDPRHVVAWVFDLRECKRLEREAPTLLPGEPSGDLPVIVSAAMREVQAQIERSAPTEATILIHGETGTGKDLIARAIHERSQRKDQPFIKVNCAAIPSGLLESELFGHEKGAFTGALARKIGRIELAHKGTIFLDEVGDIPLELQSKLLRMLQEREFERLGGSQTIQVDVRVIAATNRDLKQMVAEGSFRLDLFYRLNVFPIRVPPLRERREAIPLLVDHFVRKFNRQFRREIHKIPAEVLARLQHCVWPGNIRELENVVERAVILSPGSELRVSPNDLEANEQTAASVRSLRDVEREHIIRALREARGRVGGKTGAAALLGLKRTTLQYKMKKLGVARRRDF